MSGLAAPGRGGATAALGMDARAAQWAAHGLEAALRARAPSVHSSTKTVQQIAVRVGRELGLSAEQQFIGICTALRDVGMLFLPDALVMATGRLSPADWELINTHPVRSAELVATIEPLASTAAAVRAHHERWDGGGYPDGLQGEDIPPTSRIISACDAFVAMARDRPHRKGMGIEVALERVAEESGRQFAPDVVEALVKVVSGRTATPRTPAAAAGGPAAADRFNRGVQPEPEQRDIKAAIAELDVVPVSAMAHAAVTVALGGGSGSGGELVSAIEADVGLTVAVLRCAQKEATGRRVIASVPDAVTALSSEDLRQAIEDLPLTQFPWRTALEVRMHRLRAHAQEVARAADRLARELGRDDADEILAAALLHDVGKLVLGRVQADYADVVDVRTIALDERLRLERRSVGVDHATLGGLLVARWGLPTRLQSAVSGHHTAESADEAATVIRLADLVAHHAQGDRVDQGLMLTLTEACGLPVSGLREVLFDLPRAGGSQKRRAEPSPLSKRETTVLRGLAEAKGSKAIAADLGISESTVRSFLGTLYKKLEVNDRAQAVLKATELGWI